MLARTRPQRARLRQTSCHGRLMISVLRAEAPGMLRPACSARQMRLLAQACRPAGLRRQSRACSRASRVQGHAVEKAAVYPHFEALARLHRGAAADAAAPAAAVADEVARAGAHASCCWRCGAERCVRGRQLAAQHAWCPSVESPRARAGSQRPWAQPFSAHHTAPCLESHLLTRHSGWGLAWSRTS